MSALALQVPGASALNVVLCPVRIVLDRLHLRSPQVEPERVFFLSCPRISADPLRVLNLQDLSAGQFGPLFRCIVASLMTSRRVRCNTRFVAVLGSKEVDETLLNAKSPHLRLELVGDEIKMMYAEEVWVAATFQKAVQRFSDPELGKTWAKSARTAGWRLSHCESVQAAFQDVTHGEQTVTLLLSDTAKEPAEDALQELREESRSCKVSRVVVLLEQLGGQTSHELVASRSVKLAGGPLSTPQQVVIMNYLLDCAWNCTLQRPSRKNASEAAKSVQEMHAFVIFVYIFVSCRHSVCIRVHVTTWQIISVLTTVEYQYVHSAYFCTGAGAA
ncbi:unnamed protein product [Cladocopium goreaui]|uniref:Dynein heavy chain 7, axonemal n=1 Tax=Cladocopium goreaui TaxID=2562237 RepID=A0A9P1DRN1_9DINO|nr:unnamed protein product [Cladocopium goreaui]